MKLLLKNVASVLMLLGLVLFAQPVFAVDSQATAVAEDNTASTQTADLSNTDVSVLAKSELNRIGTTDVRVFLGKAINVIMGIMGSIALAMFVYAGFLFMVSGTTDSVEKARSILVWSSMGIVVVFASYALVQLIFATF